MVVKNQKIEEAKDLLIRATKLLSDTITGEDTTKEKLEDWMKDRIELWCRIYNESGIITNDRLHEIWKKMGKDTRGLGGFFTGKGASLQYTTDDKVVLTKNASDSIEAWTGKSIKEYAQKFKK